MSLVQLNTSSCRYLVCQHVTATHCYKTLLQSTLKNALRNWDCTVWGCLKLLSHKPQKKRLTCSRWSLSSYTVQKRHGHSLQTYGFRSSWHQTQCCFAFNELLLTNVTCEPDAFIFVWLQQILLTVSTWVRLCISVNTNMTLQFSVYLKQLPTVRTVIWSSVAVYMMVMSLQMAELAETFVTQWTLVSCVDSHVTVKRPVKIHFPRNPRWRRVEVLYTEGSLSVRS